MKIVSRHNIDTEKWDTCVRKAWCEALYGYTWYLDACCNWMGLVIGDYQAVMALPVRNKFGMSYIYTPYACQKLGVYSEKELSSDVKNAIVELLSSNFRLLDISIEDIGEIKDVVSNRNIEMQLNNPYDELFKNYSSNTKRNIKKAGKAGVSIEESFDFEALADTFLNNKVARGEAQITDEELMSMRRRYEKGNEEGRVLLLFAHDENGELLGGAMFAASESKYYFLFSGLTENGKRMGAMFAIIDAFIKRHANEDKVLDFEGSNQKGVARFYQSFGGYETEYWRLRINNLPWPFNWLKK